MSRTLTDEEIKKLDILSGKEFFIIYLIDTFKAADKEYIEGYPPTIECCMYDFFNEYGYTGGYKVVEIDQLKEYHKKIKEEMENIIKK